MPGRGTGNKNRRPREPGGALDQQTFIDLAEDRDCARGVFIVIEAAMSGTPIPVAQARCANSWGLFSGQPKSLRCRA